MILAEHIHHVGIAVADLDASVAWYERTLDLTVEKRFSLHDGRLQIVKLVSAGGVRIELLRSHDDADGPRAGTSVLQPGAAHVCFKVADVQAVADELRRRGVQITQEPQTIEVSAERNCWIADPEGNGIELIEDLPVA